MRKLPRYESYRGFVFASLSADGPDLRSYLGGVLARIDDMVDRAPDDALEIAGGCHKIVQNSNWKIFLENIHDGLHPMATHKSSIDASRAQSRSLKGSPPFALNVIMANNQTPENMDELSVYAFEWGHSYMAGFRNPRGGDAVYQEYVAALAAKKGKTRADEILSVNCHNAIFYPNASVQPSFLQMRVIFPLSVNRTRIEMWSFRLKGAPEALFELEPGLHHFVVEVDPQFGVHRLVKAIKGRSSRVLREEFPWLKSRLPSLWTNSYFVATVGGAPASAIKRYVEAQKDR